MPTNPSPHPLLNAVELADRLGLQPETVRIWGRTGRIPRVCLSPKVIRYDFTAVIEALSVVPNTHDDGPGLKGGAA